MSSSHVLATILGVFCLVGCTLDISSSTSSTSTTDLSRDEWSSDGLVLKHYGPDGALAWIEKYTPDTAGNKVRMDHFSANEVRQYYELYRFETYLDRDGTTKVARKTRMKRFLPTDIASYGQAWGYDSQGDEVLSAEYNASNTLKTYRWTHWKTASGSKFLDLQSSYSANGTPSAHELRQYADVTGWAKGLYTDRVSVDGTPNYTGALRVSYDSAGRKTIENTYDGNLTWARTSRDYFPGLDWLYRETWATAPANPAPAVPTASSTVFSDPAAPQVAFNESTNSTDSLNGLVLPANRPPIMAWPTPADLSLPSTWTKTGGQYVLPTATGTLLIQFTTLEGVDVPRQVKWTVKGLSDIAVNLTYDSLGRLTQRLVQYGNSPVLTVDLTRDSLGRVTKVDASGAMMKLPLTYTLTYSGTQTKPASLLLSTSGLAILTMDFTYGTAAETAIPYGLGSLTFDETIQAMDLSVSGDSDKLKVLRLEFSSTSGGSKVAQVYDILNKSPVLKGKLTWTVDDQKHWSDVQWRSAKPDGTFADPSWSYSATWASYVSLTSTVAVQSTDSTETTVAAVKQKGESLLSTVESFDVEKLFRLMSSLYSERQSYTELFDRTASNLLDQIKVAAGR